MEQQTRRRPPPPCRVRLPGEVCGIDEYFSRVSCLLECKVERHIFIVCAMCKRYWPDMNSGSSPSTMWRLRFSHSERGNGVAKVHSRSWLYRLRVFPAVTPL